MILEMPLEESTDRAERERDGSWPLAVLVV
jgi:hypothetical protein